MKKLANLTLVINNYGTKLQSYALCKAIKSLNLVEPEVINLQDSWHGTNVRISRKKQLIDVLKTYKLKSIKKIIDFIRWQYQFKVIRKNAASFKDSNTRKDELFLTFDKNIPYTKKVYTLDEIQGGNWLTMIYLWLVVIRCGTRQD